jgi:hypothetical protein
MTTKPAADRLTPFVAAFGSLISLISLVCWGVAAACSTAAGAALAVVNLLILRSLVLRVTAGDLHRKLPLLFLVFFKMGAFMLLVYWAISKHWVEPIAFTIGFSSLVVGLLAGSVVVALSGQRSES